MKINGKIFKRLGVKISANAPKILIATGAVCAVGGAVLAAKEGTKVEPVIDGLEHDVCKLHDIKNNMDDNNEYTYSNAEGEEFVYTMTDYRKDLIKVYLEAGLKLGKIFAPAIIIEALSVTAMLGSHKIMGKRNAALASSLLVTERAFKKYRDRVTEDFGEAYDRDARLGIRRDVEEVPVLKKSGEPKLDKDGNIKTEYREKIDIDKLDDHSFWFDSGSRNFNKSGLLDYNVDFCIDVLKYAQFSLENKGFVYENEIREAFGVPPTETGAYAGWIFDKRGDKTGCANESIDVEYFDVTDLAGNCTDEQRDKFNSEHGAILVNMKPMLSNINPYIEYVCYPREV